MKELEVEQQELETERALEMARHKLRHELQSYNDELQRQRSAAEHVHELKRRRAELAIDDNMSETALQLHRLERTAEIYEKLPLKELKVHNFVAPDSVSGGGLAALLPGISAVSQVAKEEKVLMM